MLRSDSHYWDSNGKWRPLYKAWVHMRQRCLNPKSPDYPRWGGRGITIDSRWDSYDAFAEDMGPHPGRGWTLDRIDNSKGYSKENCRWATRLTQGRNSRQCRTDRATADIIRQEYAAGGISQEALGKQYGLSKGAVWYLLKHQTWK